jgi:hypothetical protein
LVEIWTQNIPFPDMLPHEVASKVAHYELRPIAPIDSPSTIQEAVKSCCGFDPKKRPQISQIKM